MAIRSADQLGAHLIEELKWRKAELDTWEALAQSCRTHQRTGILRAGVALLYAHWEGCVKEYSRAYLEYVSRKGLYIGELRDEIAAVALRGVLGVGEQSKSALQHTGIITVLREESQTKAKISYDRSTIRTRSNLSFEVFEDIMHSIGCDATRHELQRGMIDNRLLKSRNDIAHGRFLLIELDDWRDMKVRIVEILEDVRDQLRNAAMVGAYKRL